MNKLKIIEKVIFAIFFLLSVCGCKEKKPPQVTFDVPALFKMNIDEVRKVLGKPLYDQIEPSNQKEEIFENVFEKNGEKLFVDFNPKSRRISELTLISSEEYDKLEDVMKIGNLTLINTDDYHIESFNPFAGTPPFTGIKIYIK